jgi:molybdate transport system substrate-binding protein
MRRRDFLALSGGFIAMWPDAAGAEEIKFLCASALRPAMDQLVADFQKSTGHTIAVSYANIGTIADQIRKGAKADLSVTSAQQWASLQAEGKIVSDFKVQFAQVGLGIAVRPSSAKLDLGSIDAARRTLLSVRAIAFGDPSHGSPSGADTLRLFEKLGIAEQMKSKSKLMPGSAQIIQAVADESVDFGIIHTSVIAASPKVSLASLPLDLRYLTIFVANLPIRADRPDLARAFAGFLTSPDAVAVFKVKGLEPN